MALSHLPRIIASLSALWQAVIVTKDKLVDHVVLNFCILIFKYNFRINLIKSTFVCTDSEQATCVVGSPRVVKHQLLELLSPISFHHGVNFLAAVAVAWHERRQPSALSKKVFLHCNILYCTISISTSNQY